MDQDMDVSAFGSFSNMSTGMQQSSTSQVYMCTGIRYQFEFSNTENFTFKQMCAFLGQGDIDATIIRDLPSIMALDMIIADQPLDDLNPNEYKYVTQKWDIARALGCMGLFYNDHFYCFVGILDKNDYLSKIIEWNKYNDDIDYESMAFQREVPRIQVATSEMIDPIEVAQFNKVINCDYNCDHSLCGLYNSDSFLYIENNLSRFQLSIFNHYQRFIRIVAQLHLMDGPGGTVAQMREWVSKSMIFHVCRKNISTCTSDVQACVQWIEAFLSGSDELPTFYVPQIGPMPAFDLIGLSSQIMTWLQQTKCAQKIFETNEDLRAWIKTKVEIIVNCITNAFSIELPGLLDIIGTHLRNKFNEIFDCLLNCSSTILTIAFASAIVVLAFSSILRILNFITEELFQFVYSSLFSKEEKFSAQASTNPVGTFEMLVAMLTGLGGLKYGTDFTKKVMAIGKPMMLMASVGAFGKSLAQQILVMMPTAIQMVVFTLTGSNDTIMRYNVDAWMSLASLINSLSKQSQYLTNLSYQKAFDTVYDSALKMMQDPDLTPDLRTKMMPLYSRMLGLASTIEGFRSNQITREVPFYIHLAGKPGVGKTTIAKSLIRFLFPECTEDNLYWRPSNDFWDGFADHRFILYDEFLVGTAETQEKYFKEILQLVSSARYFPNMAGLGQSPAGAKGIRATPKCVVTISNDAYPKICGFSTDALHRRRSVVVELVLKPDTVLDGMNIDLSVFDRDKLTEFPWVQFRILEPIKQGSRPNEHYPLLDFYQMRARLELIHEKHRIQMERMSLLTDSTPIDESNVTRQMANMINSIPSFIQKPPSLISYFKRQLFGSEQMEAQVKNQGARQRQKKQQQNEAASTSKPDDGVQTSQRNLALERAFRVDDSSDDEAVFPKESYKEGRLLSSEIDWDRIRYLGSEVEDISVLTTGKMLFVGTSVVVLIWGVRRLITGCRDDDVWGAQSYPPNRITASRTHVRRKAVRGHGYQPQKRSQEFILFTIGGHNAWAVPVCQRKLLIFEHVVVKSDGQMMPDGIDMTITVGGKVFHGQYDSQRIATIPDSDLMMIDFPNVNLPHFPNIIRKFATDQEMDNYEGGSVILEGEVPICSTATRIKGSQSYSRSGVQYEIDQPILTQMSTVGGDCGRPLIGNGGSFLSKILGIHTAGSNFGHKGLVVPVTQEMVEDLVSVLEDYVPQVLDSEHMKSCPNTKEFELVPFDDRVFLTRKTKIRPSSIASFLPWDSSKRPAFLEQHEELDPVEKSISDTLNSDHPLVDEEMVQAIFMQMTLNYEENLTKDFPWRELTFEEACGGVPGYLNSLRMQTSAGWPLVKLARKQGKSDFVWFEGQDLKYTPVFKTMVLDFLDNLKKGKLEDSIYLGYLKDELVSEEKFDQHRTRVIYASSLLATVAFRMLYGSVLVKMQNSHLNTPLAIGLNQYSWDMDKIYNYLTIVGDKMLAGDYKSFDKRFHPSFRKRAYDLLRDLLKQQIGFDEITAWPAFVKHETDGWAQIDKYRFKPKSLHFSGCFFTTIVNCLVNEGYIRYVFAHLNPGKNFDEHVRVKVLGDDHLICSSTEVDMSGPHVQNAMLLLGQTYTSADKTEQIPEYSKFQEVTFLGAHPRLLSGRWTGAAKKSTIHETLMWTRDSNDSLLQVATQMVELASQWDEEYFDAVQNIVTNALANVGLTLKKRYWRMLALEVAARTTDSGATFTWIPQVGPSGVSEENQTGASNTSVPGLTTFQGDRGVSSIGTSKPDIRDKILNEQQFSFQFGTDTAMLREEFDWAVTNSLGEILKTYQIPFGPLSLGVSDNIQNMAFDRCIYWRGEVELIFQINANPFAQGLLCVFFYPLGLPDDAPQAGQWTQYQHVLLSPKQNPTASIRVPYVFPRQRLNTFTRFEGTEEFLGQIYVGVLSPLFNKDNQALSVTMYSKYPDSEFTIPRPIPNESRILRAYIKSDAYKEAVSRSRAVKGISRRDYDLEQEIAKDGFVAQGQGGSKSSQNYTYNIGNVAGNMPIETTTGATGNTQTTDLDLEAAIPMDNPPLASGSVPVHVSPTGMSKSIGIVPTQALQLAPEAMYREHKKHFNPEETRIEWILGRRAYLAQVEWATTDDPGDTLLLFSMESFLGTDTQDQIPASIAILNMFMFWRADIEIEIMAVRTAYQSGRLRAVIAYGAPSIETDETNAFYGQVLDFGGDNDKHKFIIPWNQQTEYLRTYEGPFSNDVQQNYSLGLFKLAVANKLITTTETVSSSVYVIVFARFLNPKLAVPRPQPYLRFKDDVYPINMAQTLSVRDARGGHKEKEKIPLRRGEKFLPQVGVAPQQGSDVAEVRSDEEPSTQEIAETPAVPLTQTNLREQASKPCQLQISEKFEMTVNDVLEVARRMVVFPRDGPITSQLIYNLPDASGDQFLSFRVTVTPINIFSRFYAAWAGQLRYRLFKEENNISPISYYPFITKAGGMANFFGAGVQDAWYEEYANTNGCFLLSAQGFGMLLKPTEMTWATANGANFADVQVPYATHFNFSLANQPEVTLPIDESWYTGSLVWTCSTGQSVGREPNGAIYQAVGDDFNFGVWRPPVSIKIGGPYGPTAPGVGMWNFMGWEIDVFP